MSESAVFAVILLNSYFLFYNLSVPAVTSRLFPGFIIFIFYKITEYCHSFNEPSITPFTKYFWKNGYVNSTGSVVNIIIAYFNWAPDICFFIISAAICGSRTSVTCLVLSTRILRKNNCSGCHSVFGKYISASNQLFHRPTIVYTEITARIGFDSGR